MTLTGDRAQIVSILFSDIVGYSQLNSDELSSRVASFLDDFVDRYLNEDNHFLHKLMGDGLLIASYNPVDLAEIALDLRDRFRNANWHRLGFPHPLEVRIGIHAESARLRFKDGDVIDIVGHHVNSAARIEPIVEPRSVFCSESFTRHVQNDTHADFGWNYLGSRSLAKSFGDMDLYELFRSYETSDNEQSTSHVDTPSRTVSEIPQPKIRRDFSDRDQASFLIESFQILKEYFQQALSQLESSNTDIETSFSDGNEEFRCEIYLNGELRTNCRFWIANEFGSRSILYSEGQHWSDGSHNDSLHVKNDGYELFLKPLMSSTRWDEEEQPKTPAGLSKSFWIRFTKTLE